MVERKILILKDKAYKIDKSYSLEMKRLSDQIMKNYFSGHIDNKSLPTQKQEEMTTYEFEDLIKVDQFWAEIVLDWVYNLKGQDDHRVVFQGPHCWYIFGHLALEYNYISELKAHSIESYYLINEDTPLDKWASKFYNNWATYKINSPNPEMKTVIGVFGNYVIQYDYPEELYSQLEKFYQDSKDLESVNLRQIAEILKFKTKIKVIVMKNKTIALKLKEEILSKFK